MILIKNIEIYAPSYMGVKDVFIADNKIMLIEDNIEVFNEKIRVIDGRNKKLLPGFIDNHVHIIGGGGEGSFKTRVPEISLSKLTEAGITTVIGLLGTDSTTRNIENLLAKAKGLKEEGISVYIHTGAYAYPSINLTGSVVKDIMFIEEIIGVKIALSDHRSSNITKDELSRLASDIRVAGMLSNKAGVAIIHMGDGDKKLSLVREILNETDIPVKTMIPTHVNRNRELLEDAFEYAKIGGIIDLTCGVTDDMIPSKVVLNAEKENIPLENIIISSDGYGSWSNYDEYGNLIEIGVSSVDKLYDEFCKMVVEFNMDIEMALKFYTENVAKALKLYPKKGIISEDSDADLLIVDSDMKIDTVIANGKLMIFNGELLVKGTYEK